ncbi:TPA: 5,10-methylenetetrahydrofolate reductase [Candidatus Bipolaricaulota bacterium]|nr:5,10-methylenetetrahydrofolate reductase [Candidatus Bipolaricaulota bacterium]
MGLRERLANGEFVVTCEAAPPKGTEVGPALEEVRKLAPYVHAFNVTDLQSSVLRMSSWALCALIVREGFEPVVQLTCRDRNRLALQADLLGAWALGIENVLALTGDYPTLGDHPGARPVFDLDSVQLIAAIQALNSGRDLAGNELTGSTGFFVGAVVNPGVEPLAPHLLKMRLKVNMGAQFFQTQAVYDPERFMVFIAQAETLGRPILAGIIPLKSARMARFMNEHIAGISVPQEVIREMERAKTKEDRRKRSVEICARIIREVKPYCQGIHLMPMGWEDLVPDILELAGITP